MKKEVKKQKTSLIARDNEFALTPAFGSNKPKTRVGRGHAAGKGKQAGRGQSGQKKRSTVRIGFEGGQNPWYRRIPKRGKRSLKPKIFEIINLDTLNANFETNASIDLEALKTKKLLSKNFEVKILADGKLEKTIHLKGLKTSKTAKNIIEKLGGSVV